LPNPAGLSLLGHRVTIDIMRSDGSFLTDFTPSLGVCFTYSAADLAIVGGDPSKFTIWTAPLGALAWEALPTTLYAAQSRVCVQAAHLSDFALFGQPGPVTALPATGFAPGEVTLLPQQPAALAYGDLGDLWLEIPRLGVQTAIVGVPTSGGNWDVSWLGSQAGWLEGSAFPTLAGNSTLTAHVYDANGLPGPFLRLNQLWYGDRIIVHAFGQEYVYEVRQVRQVRPNDTSMVTRHEEYPWLTLLTCRGYDPASGQYLYRVAVRAVLVEVR
jgi:LPXTG-site transpeptidase (sortase) family protein